MPHYDTVIVGSGLAGLSCGLALTQKGKRVVIREQHSAPGGYVTSFSRKGFRFDAGAGCFSSGGMVLPILRSLGVAGALQIRPIRLSALVGGERLVLDSPESVIDASAASTRTPATVSPATSGASSPPTGWPTSRPGASLSRVRGPATSAWRPP